jgi:hypothetical protein
LSRGRKITLVVGIVVAAGLLGYALERGALLMRIGANHAAKQTCSCLFVSGRPLDACRAEFTGLEGRLLSLEAGEAVVEARMLGLFTARAEFEEGYGCDVAR